MSYLSYFPAYNPITADAPVSFEYPIYRSFASAKNYIDYYAAQFGHRPTDYTTGFTRKINTGSEQDVDDAYNELMTGSMVDMQAKGTDVATAIFCLSYSSSLLPDGTYGLAKEDWKRAVSIAATRGYSAVFWVDILDRENRKGSWGNEQLKPYLIYPVIFVATAPSSRIKQQGLRMWPAIEATMGQLGAGLITDRIAENCGPFIPFQAKSGMLYYSVTAPEHPKVQNEAFELHIASGRFRGCPTFHQGDYNRIHTVLKLKASRWQDANGDSFPSLKRLELRFSGMAIMRLEVTSTRWLTTELSRWTGKKEWMPQEGGMIAADIRGMVECATLSGEYEVFFDEQWLYCIVNREGKLTLLRMAPGDAFSESGFEPAKLKCNAYARMPIGKHTAFLGNILGVEAVRKFEGSHDLGMVEWK